MVKDEKYSEILQENNSLKKRISELEEEKKLLKNIYDVAPAGIFVYDENSIITNCNEAFVNVVGSSQSQLIGFNMREKLNDDNLLEQIEKALETGSGYYEGIYQSVTANKSTPVRINLRKFEKDTTYVIGVAIDITDEYKYRDNLKEQKEYAEQQQTSSQNLLDASPDLICFKDGEGRWIQANNADLELLDLVGKDYKGKTDLELIQYSPSLKEAFELCYKTDEEAWKSKKTTRTEETIKKLNGTERTYDVIKKPIFNDDGSRKGLVMLGRDITERKKAENMLRENEQKLNFIMDNIPGMLFTCLAKKQWPMQFVSKGALELTGYEPEIFLKDSFTYDQIIIPEDREKVWNIITEKIKAGEHYNLNYKIRTKDGKVKTVWEHGRKVGENNERIDIIEGIIYDVTLQEEYRNKLMSSEQKYRAIIENSQEAIFIMDAQGRIHEANPKACELIGYTENEIKNLTMKDVVVVAEQNESMLTLNKLRKNIHVPTYEKHFKTSTGEIIPVEISVALIKDINESELLISVIRDITDRKKFEKELMYAKDRAEESDKLKSAFLANMSHEIRTPMNGIVGFSQLLRDESITKEEMTEYIDIISSNSQHLLKLIDDIINISKIEANQLEINMYKFNINNTMKEIETLFKSDSIAMKKNKVELINDSYSDESHYILSDPTRIKQIMTNLIKNAMNFTEKGRVRFGYIIKNDMIEFYVKDTGIGIPEKKQQAIFERFVQVENKQTAKIGGTGLGLSISKGLVELMKGDIRLDSTVGVGTNFYFSIPYNKSNESNIRETKDEIKNLLINWEDKTILIAEDNPTNYILLERMLRPTKINILKAVNGKEAIDIFTEKHNNIDLVLMDIKMPILDGYQATQEIRKFDKTTPVIAVTAYAMHGDKRKSELAGCDDYLPKPLSKVKLIEVMSKHF